MTNILNESLDIQLRTQEISVEIERFIKYNSPINYTVQCLSGGTNIINCPFHVFNQHQESEFKFLNSR